MVLAHEVLDLLYLVVLWVVEVEHLVVLVGLVEEEQLLEVQSWVVSVALQLLEVSLRVGQLVLEPPVPPRA